MISDLSFLEFQDAIKLAENDVFQAREGREKRITSKNNRYIFILLHINIVQNVSCSFKRGS